MKKRLPIIRLSGYAMICFLLGNTLFSQNPISSKSDSVWVYRLTPKQQARWMTERVNWQFEDQNTGKGAIVLRPNQKVKTLPLRAKETYREHPLPYGMYFWIYAASGKLITLVDHRTGLMDVQLLPGKKQSWLWVAHEKVRNNELKMTFKGKPLAFDKEKDLFLLPGKKRMGWLKIQAGNDLTFHHLKKDGFKLPPRHLVPSSTNAIRNLRPYKFPERWLGYIALNKPRYRPGDTLKLKAYCMDREGNPLDIPLILELGVKTIKELVPSRPGLYQHEMVLTDSLGLRLDIQHVFYLQKTALNTIAENHFIYEDYELDEATFHFKLENEEITYGEPLEIFAYTQDANGLDLPGGTLDIKITFKELVGPPEVPTYLPRVLYHDTLELASSKEPILTLEPDKLPKAPCRYYIDAQFTTETREQETRSTSFEITPPEHIPVVNWLGDSLWVEGPRDSTAEVVMTNEMNRQTRHVIPFAGRISPAIQSIKWEMGNQSEEIEMPYVVTLVRPVVFRKQGKAFFGIQNPCGLPLQVELWRNDRLISSWQLNGNLDTAFIAKKNEHFRMVLFIPWRGTTHKMERILPILNEYLDVTVEQPMQAQPGEELELVVTVTDVEGKPVEGVDLTSMAVNARFHQKKSNVPRLPILGTPLLTRQQQVYGKVETSQFKQRTNKFLDATRIKDLGLKNLIYYQLTYPDSITSYYWQSDQQDIAQFAPYVFKDGVQEQVYFIYLNGKLIYFSGADAQPTYAFSGPADTVNLKIRTLDAACTINGVVLRKGEKLELSINLDYASSRVTWEEKEETFSWKERRLVNQRFMYIEPPGEKSKTMALWQRDRVFLAKGEQYRKKRLVGPLGEREIACAVSGEFIRRFTWQSGYLHKINRFSERLWKEGRIVDENTPLNKFRAFQQFGQEVVTFEHLTINLPQPYRVSHQSLTYTLDRGDLMLAVKGKIGALTLGLVDDGVNEWIFSRQRMYKLPPGTYRLKVYSQLNQLTLTDTFTIKKDSILAMPEMEQAPAEDLPRAAVDWKTGYYPGARTFINDYLIDPAYKRQVKVIDTAGVPITGAEIVCFNETMQALGAITDSIGCAMIPSGMVGYRMKVLRVAVLHPSYRPVVKYVDPGPERLTVVLEPFLKYDPTESFFVEGMGRPHHFGKYSPEIPELSMSFLRDDLPTYVEDDTFDELTPNKRIVKIGLDYEVPMVRTAVESGLAYRPVPKYLKYGHSDQLFKRIKHADELTGRVFDMDGKPLAFATILLYDGDNFVKGVRSAENGSYKFTGLSGVYTVKAKYLTFEKVIENVPAGVNLAIRFTDDFSNSVMEEEDIPMSSIDEVVIEDYKVPVFEKEAPAGVVIGQQEIYSIGTRSTQSLVAITPGVYQSDDGDNAISIRGSRSTATVYYIDGQKVRGGANLPQAAIAELRVYPGFSSHGYSQPRPTGRPEHLTDSITEFYPELDEYTEPSVIDFRETFRDYAWWQPDLLTDSLGQARFKVRVPDDLTGWNTHVLAVGPGGSTGQQQGFLKVFRELSARLSVPRFLIEGDSSSLIGRVIRYNAQDSLDITTRFQEGETPLLSGERPITTYFTEEQTVIAPTLSAQLDTDTLTFSYELAVGKLQDGEKRKVPVFKRGVKQSEGVFAYLEGDTTWTFQPDPQLGPVRVSIAPDGLSMLVKDLNKLAGYAHDCNEQMSSKLRALALLEEIETSLGQSFSRQKDANRLIRKLKKSQNDNGSWGWWEGNAGSLWMTTYVTQALHEWKPEIKPVTEGKSYLKDSVETVYNSYYRARQLKGFLAMQKMGLPIDTLAFFSAFAADTFPVSDYEWLLMARLRQVMGTTPNLDSLMSRSEQTASGGRHWGHKGWGWYGKEVEMTVLAYEMLRDHGGQEARLREIRNHWFERRGSEGWGNTVESASILATLAPDILAGEDEGNHPKDISPKIQLTQGESSFILPSFPHQQTLGEEEIAVKKIGPGPLFISAWQEHWNPNPWPVDSLFSVRTQLIQNGRKVDALKAGTPAILEVNLHMRKRGSYLALEVPIPAGCSYGPKRQFGAHTEYRKHKATLYFHRLLTGRYTFRIKLEPRFTGTYHLNPAMIEQMYLPVKYGRNGVKKVNVKK
ncbi:MAG: carboxypeptidase regulatory-like domain-containing protein [Bacteroidota bacterium]